MTLLLQGDEATAQLAQDLAMVAEPGWVIALEGDLGVGKTTFARAFIRTLAGDPHLEVPSPTYTLVQRYDEAEPAVLHADLYRLTNPDEMIELGLDDADDPAIRLIEWPGNAGEGAFPGALTLKLDMASNGTARTAEFCGPQALLARVDRTLGIRRFLEASGHGDGQRSRLQGDASTRRYERFEPGSLVLMDAARQPDGPIIRDGKPYSQLVHLAESVHAFTAVGTALCDKGFAAPVIEAGDLDAGLLLIENLGSNTILLPDGSPDPARYRAAVDVLGAMHMHSWKADLPIGDGTTHHVYRYDSDVFLTEIALLPDWYVEHRGVDTGDFDRDGFFAAWRTALAPLEEAPRTLTLRDYHSPNIIWRGDKTGHERIGLIDHQDALLGPFAYDVAALIQDARVTISPQLQEDLLQHYCKARLAVDATFDQEALIQSFALMAAQRNSKILGIFARLNARDGKPAYLKHLPRIETYMQQLLEHDVLSPLRPYYDQLLPKKAS